MANNYYEGTGVLMLERVTPIITALFGDFSLDANYPGGGQAYIAIRDEINPPDWSDIARHLARSAPKLGINVKAGADIVDVLRAYARHYQREDDEDMKCLLDEQHVLKEDADLETLFRIASLLNDGHQLAAIRFEGCWYCSRPRLFEFGGDAFFYSREIKLSGSTRQTMNFAADLHVALTQKDVSNATAIVTRQTLELLNAIDDAEQREAVRRGLIERLSENSPTPDVPSGAV
jgi:hypothetical protein